MISVFSIPNAANDGVLVDVDIVLLWVKMSPRVAGLVVLNVERRIRERMKDGNLEEVNNLGESPSFICFVLCLLWPNISASANQHIKCIDIITRGKELCDDVGSIISLGDGGVSLERKWVKK